VNPVIKKLKTSILNTYEDRLLSTIVDFSKCSTGIMTLVTAKCEPGPLTTSFDDVCIYLTSSIPYDQLYPSLTASCGIQDGHFKCRGHWWDIAVWSPGTGKTMVCRALAKECKANMLQIKPSDVMDKWVGETEKLVRAIL